MGALIATGIVTASAIAVALLLAAWARRADARRTYPQSWPTPSQSRDAQTRLSR